MKKSLLIIISLFMLSLSYAQSNEKFISFAAKQDSLMIKAYEIKNVKEYKNQLDKLEQKYDQLSSKDQKMHFTYMRAGYYNFACLYSLLDQKQKALDYLEKSNYEDYEHLLQDSDLNNIRKEPRFEKCLAYAKLKSPNYIQILKDAQQYNNSDSRKLFFSYQSSDNENLKKLRQQYKLDSIAGNGNEISKIINLMRWVHNLIPHDGQHGFPDETKNASNLISVCVNNKKPLNCRGLAIVLNEVYLAMNVKSRYITCLPKDSSDLECHVINMVYSQTLAKWVWMDPTTESYVMNEKGELLSIEEVRERLINGQPLILNPDANWNHQVSQTKKAYLDNYMSKNLYRFECPVSSEYNYETKMENKIIKYNYLIPSNHNPKEEKQRHSNGIITTYTSNLNEFWAKPE